MSLPDRDLALLSARAVELARPLDELQEDGTIDLLVLVVGRQHLALPVESVRAVRPPGPVARVPAGTSALAGMVTEQGNALPVAFLATLLGLPVTAAAAEHWTVVLNHATAPVGLLADAAVDILTARRADVRPPAEQGGLVAGLLPDGAIVLDAPALLRDPRLSVALPHPTEEPS